jgi:cytochrome c oxidase assembly protein subunit 11
MAVSRNSPNKDWRSKWVAGAVLLTAVAMLGLSFAAVPLYKLFCARTGYAGTTQVAKVAPTIRGNRTIIVRFDTNVAPGLTWKFLPEVPQVKLLTGATATVFFKVTNLSDRETAARAGYNVAPGQTGAYFNKISCFCFKEQYLGPHETMEMPVVFFLDPALEQDETMNRIDEITLSYTFYPEPLGNPVTAAQEGQEGPRL